MIYPRDILEIVGETRGANYVEDVLRVARNVTADTYELDRWGYLEIQKKWNPAVYRQLIKQMGWGDKLEYFFHRWHLDLVAVLWKKVTGKDCGCTKRRDGLNKIGMLFRGKVRSWRNKWA